MKVANISTYGGKVAETTTMPESKQVLSWGTLSVEEYGNSIPFTFKLEALSEFEIKNIIREGLLDDAVKVIDGEIERQFDACKLRYVSTATNAAGTVTTNGTATVTNTSAFNAFHVRKMVNQMKTRNVPGFSGLGGDHVCICSIEALEGLYADVEDIWQYTESGYKKILEGEVGRYYGTRFVEDTFATRYTYDSTAKTATAKTWTKSKSLDAYLFGSPTVREAIVVPEEIRGKIVTDFGRSKGIAWYMLGGWKIEWDDEPNARIIKWDSAA